MVAETDGLCRLIILGENLSFSTITSNLQLTPTNDPNLKVWEYEISYGVEEDFNDKLNHLLKHISREEIALYLIENKDKWDIVIRCFVQSLAPNFQYTLSLENIAMLSHLNLNCTFSLLSWGEIESD
jgi:hypothetical protein